MSFAALPVGLLAGGLQIAQGFVEGVTFMPFFAEGFVEFDERGAKGNEGRVDFEFLGLNSGELLEG